MQCDYFDAGQCRSCTRMGVPYETQLRAKTGQARDLLSAHPDLRWLEPVRSPESGFRNKAKMVVGGTVEAPTLGILDERRRGVDLSGCGLYPAPITEAMESLRSLITTLGMTPYDVAARRGEAKYVIVTLSPDGDLMIRFVLRSKKFVVPLKRSVGAIRESIPRVRVVSVNILREHKAVLEGEEEIVLTDESSLPMRLNGITLNLRPQGFFQTNSGIAAAMYEQGARWFVESGADRLADLYCGVGGFALHAARAYAEAHPDDARADDVRVTGIELNAEAIAAARRSADELGFRHVRFRAGDATDYRRDVGRDPAAMVVNPPRRGIGEDLARWIDESTVQTLIYSSCHAVTLAKDLERMPSFRAVQARLFDMFPQTEHYETMVLLRRR